MHPELNKYERNLSKKSIERRNTIFFVEVLENILVIYLIIFFIFFQEIALREGSKTFQWWKLPPVNPVIRVYVYNVTNADAFLNNGEKPVLDELGPFTYM